MNTAILPDYKGKGKTYPAFVPQAPLPQREGKAFGPLVNDFDIHQSAGFPHFTPHRMDPRFADVSGKTGEPILLTGDELSELWQYEEMYRFEDRAFEFEVYS